MLAELAGGDRRSIGAANAVVADVLNNPALFVAVFDGMLSTDPLIRMRSADVVEKVTALRPDYLRPYKDRLLLLLASSDQQEVRWHLAQMAPRLPLNPEERATAVEALVAYLSDKSRIVKTSAMQGLAELALGDARLRAGVIAVLEECVRTGSPAMKSRGRKLLARLANLPARAESRSTE